MILFLKEGGLGDFRYHTKTVITVAHFLMRTRAAFLANDGTLVEDLLCNPNPDRIRLLHGATEGLRLLHAAGYRLIVVSNQAGVAHGHFPEEAVAAVKEQLRNLLAEADVPLAGFYYCPHHPRGTVPPYAVACSCRKPEPGLILHAAREHQVDLAHSWLIGDILNDIEAGRRSGCKTVMINNGGETGLVLSPGRRPHYFAADLTEAASIITFVSAPTQPTILRYAYPRGVVLAKKAM